MENIEKDDLVILLRSANYMSASEENEFGIVCETAYYGVTQAAADLIEAQHQKIVNLSEHNRRMGYLLQIALNDDEAPMTGEWREKVFALSFYADGKA